MPGDIVAVIGLKDTTTGDTLCDPAFPVILEKMDFPEPVIKVAVEPESKKEQDKMTEALMRLAAEVCVSTSGNIGGSARRYCSSSTCYFTR